MKQTSLILALIVCITIGVTPSTLSAQNFRATENGNNSKELPTHYSFLAGGGWMFPAVKANKNDFFNANGNRTGYHLTAEGRYYPTPFVGLGLQYDYLNAVRLPDKMHVHFIHPTALIRYLMDESTKSLYLSIGIGYLNYQERVYGPAGRNGQVFSKSYCGISFGVGYEFLIAKNLSGVFKIDIPTTDWVANPDARLSNTDGYDDGVNHSWFKNNITFFNLGFALQFGQ